MNKVFIVLLMVFFHIIDDYKLQGILASMKQKKWWEEQKEYIEKYQYDYIWALITHSFSWSFMIMLPIALIKNFEVGITFVNVFIFNIIILHVYYFINPLHTFLCKKNNLPRQIIL